MALSDQSEQRVSKLAVQTAYHWSIGLQPCYGWFLAAIFVSRRQN